MVSFQLEQVRKGLEIALGEVPAIISLAIELAPHIDNVQMVSCGTGDSFMERHLLKFFHKEARSSFQVSGFKSADYAICPPRRTDNRTLLMVSSVSGATDDTLLAINAVADRVRCIVAFTGRAECPIAEKAHKKFNTAGAVDPYSASCLQMLVFFGKLMEIKEGWGGMQNLLTSLPSFPSAYVAASHESSDLTTNFADQFKEHDKMLIVSTGNVEELGFVIADCNMVEKLKIFCEFVEASRFFHGPLELVKSGVPVILILGEDEYRPLMGPVQKFCSEQQANAVVYDTINMALPGILYDTRPLLSPLILRAALKGLVSALAAAKGSNLDHRHFYGKVKYTVEQHGTFMLGPYLQVPSN
ncbi:hypothetical protein [Rhizobium sp. NLR22b]|uniref:hypothetical protein n=1 Tax=Rhizobium sp. NLR22b TaxID=2731115 RepID=UPI001C82CBCC|nr:hypothetical protein [Rhizobium sp. NLR22b]MBX5242055.1 hypothetical protein [Rhizobium sp. NLR22b]